jgi:GT2 family glycosyltransferase
MTISVIIITYKRLRELKETIQSLQEETEAWDELILIDNHSEDGTKAYGEELMAGNAKIKFYSLTENLGVAGGRNYGVKQASGDVLVFLDDDAVFDQKGYFSVIREKMEKDPAIGALAFRVINFYTGQMRTEEMPFTDKKLDMGVERLTSTFIGAGHAIRREVFEKCGLYPEDYFYGVEELDLSFRIIDQGCRILYFPSVRVLHKQVNTGRVTNQEKWIMSYRNRMLTAYKYLPTKYVVGLGIVLFGKIAIRSRSITAPAEGLRRYRKARKVTDAHKIGREALGYLKSNYGRLWI